MNKIKDQVHEDFLNLKKDKEKYFKDFYENNYNLVYKICLSILKDKESSEDVAQNVFEKIYKLPNGKLAENFESTWLYTVTKNEAIQYLRKNKFSFPLDEKIDLNNNDDNEFAKIEGSEEYKNLVRNLNKKQEQIISLRILANFTFKEIGEILSIPTATVQWHYYRSIKSLKIALGNLAMFFITFILGAKMQSNFLEKVVNDNTENTDNNMIYEEKGENQDATSFVESENTKGELSNDNIESVLENTIEKDIEYNTNSNIHISLISLSSIFLIISIIFSIIFIKSQQKLKVKSSKK